MNLKTFPAQASTTASGEVAPSEPSWFAVALESEASGPVIGGLLAIGVLWALFACLSWLPVNDRLSAYVTEHYAAAFASRGLRQGTVRNSVAWVDDADGSHRVCEASCNPTSFDRLKFNVLDGGRIEVRVDVDTSERTFDQASQEVDKAVQALMKDYDAHARVRASWQAPADKPGALASSPK